MQFDFLFHWHQLLYTLYPYVRLLSIILSNYIKYRRSSFFWYIWTLSFLQLSSFLNLTLLQAKSSTFFVDVCTQKMTKWNATSAVRCMFVNMPPLIVKVVFVELFLAQSLFFVLTTNSKWAFIPAKKHVNITSKSTICVSCEKEFHSYHLLQQHCKKDHGLKAKKMSDCLAVLYKVLEKEEDNDQLRDELNACEHFLAETETEKRRHQVLIFHFSKLVTIVFE